MDTVKNSIIDQIVYFLQAFEENNNMLHTIIEGPPGVGKTMLGYILGKIYFNMGVLKGSQNAMNSLTGKKDDFVFKIVKRKDLIGEYLGHTAVKTQKAIDECKGGVLFIDEAYSLGNLDKKDTYSKECIDTINQNLSENKNNFMCIIAGYPEQLEQCFFSYNEGLKRRFTFKYTIEKYNGKELCNIFKKMVLDSKWEVDIDDKVVEEFINENFGGDMETLLFRTKITHSKRVFGVHPRNKKKITIDDIVKAFELFKSNKKKEINVLSEEVLRNIYT
jgi:SpoVK/Ycf46/Vps4 family AAA+-type ATPase